jgi:hypothetical protein
MKVWVLSAFTVAATVAASQTSGPLKVYISADMEGVGGAGTGTSNRAPRAPTTKYRRLMTLEVNAAIAGAYDAGDRGARQRLALGRAEASIRRLWTSAFGSSARGRGRSG